MSVFGQFLVPLAPIVALVGGGCALIGAECVGNNFLSVRGKMILAWISAALAVGFCVWQFGHVPVGDAVAVYDGPVWLVEFARFYRWTTTTVFLQLIIAIFAFFVLDSISGDFKRGDILGEVLALCLWSGAGMMLLVSADHFVVIFLGLELLSLPLYALVGLKRWDAKSLEASLKYFLFGSVATAFLLLGIALIYGETATMSLPKLRDYVVQVGQSGQLQEHVLLLAGILLMVVAIGFKSGLFPFHMWLPDVYEGAPAGVTAWMGSGVKLAAIGLAFRVFVETFSTIPEAWMPAMRWIVAGTILVGNAAALVQDDLKRMFAYSSIGHAGFLMLGVMVAPSDLGAQPGFLFYYLLVYGLMFIGLFSFLAYLEREGIPTEMPALSGLGFTSPVLGLCLAIFALSAAGIPPLAGFFAKYQVFLFAVGRGEITMTIIALLGSLVGLAYYLRVLVFLYMKEPEGAVRLTPKSSPATYATLAVLAASLLVLSVLPGIFGK